MRATTGSMRPWLNFGVDLFLCSLQLSIDVTDGSWRERMYYPYNLRQGIVKSFRATFADLSLSSSMHNVWLGGEWLLMGSKYLRACMTAIRIKLFASTSKSLRGRGLWTQTVPKRICLDWYRWMVRRNLEEVLCP